MGNSPSQNEREINRTISNIEAANLTETIDSEPPVLETTVKKRDLFLRCCLCYGGSETDQEAIPWCLQIQGYLVGKYNKCGWSKPLLRQLHRNIASISTIQAYFINDVRKLQ
jgi:hypothetical protein